MTKLFYVILTVIIFSNCKVSESDITGYYRMKHFPKSTLTINTDKTFEFVQDYANPFLHPFEHPEHQYIRTTGAWNFSKNELVLTSTQDSLNYPLFNIQATDTTSSSCHYVFYDIHNDTIPILFVNTKEGLVARLHRAMRDFSWDKSKKDTLEFVFFGYKSLKIVNGENGKSNYRIYLNYEFKPNFFNNTSLKVTRNRVRIPKKDVVFSKR